MFMGFLGNAYPWVKAAHLIFVIFWMAGLFMLPRFFIYHSASAPGSAEDRAWVERERRLRAIIITPAMILVWLFGLALAFDQDLWGVHWFQAKFATVFLLSGYHGWMIGYGRRMASGYRPASDTALRFMNEAPAIATAIVVILVIVRPF
ncbi:CopD family protein [Rhizorhabdus dicambivorans]|uniref:Protoporphyrinogen IX oxidase n=1 Tax=Rhizorhabdus dicambivorans TaxID=1850238 RepID=A0A2A4FXH0_9SPHN|nr:CopD family protein [Rhizorhabdus dicambivorans]ATE63280.1 CopD family protein [Rhizorhabdus dicambivorans]PCE43494.1 CopD family protein [Rhizorhabdus dicambivorans]